MCDETQETSPILPGAEGHGKVRSGPAHRDEGMSVLNTSILLVGEMVGIGVLTLPKVLAQAGWGATVLLCGVCLISAFNGVHLGWCWSLLLERYPEYRQHVRDPYPAICEVAVGRWMRYITSLTLAISLFGCCVICLLLVAQNIHSLLGQSGVNVSFCLWMVLVAVVLTPFQWFGSPKDFWFVGVFASSSSVAACILLFVSFMVESPSGDDVTYNHDTTFNSVFIALGSMMFSYGGVPTFPTVQHDMKDPSEFKKAVIGSTVILLCLYLPICVTGYLVYGNGVNSNVILSLPTGGLQMSIEVLLTVHLFFAFTILLNPFSQELEKHLKIPTELCVRRVLLRSGVMGSILFVGQSIPHFGGLLSLVGGSTLSYLTFVAPSVCYLRLYSQSGDWMETRVPAYQKVTHGLIIAVGVFGGIAATYSAALVIVSPDSFVPPCYVNSSVSGG